ncbi:hypothetical protein IFM89_025087 [Coptis chinensis]|uniref:ENTH domain-containing protein n=1 Tax=Coptis chinensis TaxID=261450 RepID=A0A835LSD8_9MAGN|nr:hypothetical protein IFM89_025087 [Coptis chinensis]
MLVHRLLSEGDPVFQKEILYAARKGTRLLNLFNFRDEAHSNSWDHYAFVRTYALYLDKKLECLVYEKKQQGSGGDDRPPPRSGSYGDVIEAGRGGGGDDERKKGPVTPKEMKMESVLGRISQFQRLLNNRLSPFHHSTDY